MLRLSSSDTSNMGRMLSQDEIDKVFNRLKEENEELTAKKAVVYDFRRPDRIAKDQLRSIHLLHDNFARNLASSLSGYLRAYVIVNLISVEQLSFAEFAQCLPSPTVLVALAVTELAPVPFIAFSNAGSERKEPPPATVFSAPARNEATGSQRSCKV